MGSDAAVTRIKLDLTQKIVERLTIVQKLVGAADFTDVVKRALIVYDMLVMSKERGATILVREKDGETAELKWP